jgi:hypothetical protein
VGRKHEQENQFLISGIAALFINAYSSHKSRGAFLQRRPYYTSAQAETALLFIIFLKKWIFCELSINFLDFLLPQYE